MPSAFCARVLDNLLTFCSLHMTFVQKDGSRKRVPAQVGMTVLDVAHAHDVDLEGAPVLCAY